MTELLALPKLARLSQPGLDGLAKHRFETRTSTTVYGSDNLSTMGFPVPLTQSPLKKTALAEGDCPHHSETLSKSSKRVLEEGERQREIVTLQRAVPFTWIGTFRVPFLRSMSKGNPGGGAIAHGPWWVCVSLCWNSILESFWHGVPIVTWPIYAEQLLNDFTVKELGLAVELRLDYRGKGAGGHLVPAEEIERVIKCWMGGGGAATRKKVKEMREAARDAVKEGGSSYDSIGKLIQDFIKNIE
ncbi:UDP-glycosyltransferase 71C3-like [Rhodamnia argentea]|uniref:UDP-glycosyltransferase 71C3-like n=1 Tax=Rhodamnia argentea TaxID=178133 RepID=A0ABM3HUG4_9MYRT|nr:UDP-glycosyltransferase 71C3-like [Rhodamnia argentea]